MNIHGSNWVPGRQKYFLCQLIVPVELSSLSLASYISSLPQPTASFIAYFFPPYYHFCAPFPSPPVGYLFISFFHIPFSLRGTTLPVSQSEISLFPPQLSFPGREISLCSPQLPFLGARNLPLFPSPLGRVAHFSQAAFPLPRVGAYTLQCLI